MEILLIVKKVFLLQQLGVSGVTKYPLIYPDNRLKKL